MNFQLYKYTAKNSSNILRHQHNEAKTEWQSDKCTILPFFVIDDINSWIILLFACMPNVVFKEQNIESPTRRRWLKKDFISRDVPFSIPKTIQWQKFRIKQKSISSYKKSVGIYVWIHYVWQAYNVWQAVSAVVPHTNTYNKFRFIPRREITIDVTKRNISKTLQHLKFLENPMWNVGLRCSNYVPG